MNDLTTIEKLVDMLKDANEKNRHLQEIIDDCDLRNDELEAENQKLKDDLNVSIEKINNRASGLVLGTEKIPM